MNTAALPSADSASASSSPEKGTGAPVLDIAIDAIVADDRCQPRAMFDTELVGQYAEAMANGDAFPPVTLFHDGIDYFLADGFHRYRAAVSLGLVELAAVVRRGTLRDAILHSCSANASHGWRRTNDDKRRAVLRLLNDAEWAMWSDREIARKCSVGHPFVASLRPKVVTGTSSSEPAQRTYVTKHGTVSTMRTENIGSAPKARDDDKPVFDSTSAGERIDVRPPATIEHVNRESGMANTVWELIRLQKRLPGADDAADRFPSLLLHSLSVQDLRAAASWLATFANGIETRKANIYVAAE